MYMLLKNLINNLPEDKKKLQLKVFQPIAKKLERDIFFLLLEDTIVMVKNLLNKQSVRVHL